MTPEPGERGHPVTGWNFPLTRFSLEIFTYILTHTIHGKWHIIFTYIWLVFMVNVGKYTIHGSYGLHIQSYLLRRCHLGPTKHTTQTPVLQLGRWYDLDSSWRCLRDQNIRRYGCFLKWWYPQNTPKWSFLVGKPMVVGYPYFRKHPYKQNRYYNQETNKDWMGPYQQTPFSKLRSSY